MKFYFHPMADKELLELSRDKQKFVKDVVREFKEEGMNYKRFGKFTDKNADIDCFRLKLKEKESIEINQRVIISIIDQKFVAYGIEHRENVYSEDYLEKVKDRMY